jgi:hypothetical protein
MQRAEALRVKSNKTLMVFVCLFYKRRCFRHKIVLISHFLHTDLNIPYVSEVINERIEKHLNKLESHPNPLVETLTQPMRN